MERDKLPERADEQEPGGDEMMEEGEEGGQEGEENEPPRLQGTKKRHGDVSSLPLTTARAEEEAR